MLRELLKENEGKDIEISYGSRIKYLAMSYVIKGYRMKVRKNLITLYDRKCEFVFNEEELGEIRLEDGIIYIRQEDMRLNLIIRQISSLDTLAREQAADLHTIPG